MSKTRLTALLEIGRVPPIFRDTVASLPVWASTLLKQASTALARRQWLTNLARKIERSFALLRRALIERGIEATKLEAERAIGRDRRRIHILCFHPHEPRADIAAMRLDRVHQQAPNALPAMRLVDIEMPDEATLAAPMNSRAYKADNAPIALGDQIIVGRRRHVPEMRKRIFFLKRRIYLRKTQLESAVRSNDGVDERRLDARI